jgi:hypothetical protein
MCPFCISALAVAAAKTLSAAGGGGALVAKLALKKRGNADEPRVDTPDLPYATSIDGPRSLPTAVIATSSRAVEPTNLERV